MFGKEMSSALPPLIPRTHRERIRLLWVLVGAANFLAFVAHMVKDGTCTLFGGGRWMADQYLAYSHGSELPFTATGFWFSYIHGWLFLIVHFACMVAIWWLKKEPVPTK